ncbi:hypothetical protein BT63DRAFT_426186 [Microthyrium microscopicum]|uniref:Phenol 2-monooxygenase n=1 Tax=Microthyrium microscopicum TaxID=703497 RepID=A0A6A6U4S0_9PEZI|nr:hypothetical protein BT63DRAFT_426186 [Microthyrium microscopicum]
MMAADNIPRYDIVIIGAGPVGLMLSTCLARWGYRIKHIDNRRTPTATGRADGIQPRSLDLLRNMGLKRAIMDHAPAKVYEVAFWDPSGKGIERTGTWASCPAFIDARYPFTTLLHQGHIERVFLKDMTEHGVNVQRPWTIEGFENDEVDELYPVKVEVKHVETGEREVVRAKYLFSGEGAKSMVRETLGIKVVHKDPIAHVWGVMDGVVNTNFPDIKMKCTIHSDAGSIMVIPREDNMVRLYIQIASSTDPDFNPRQTATEEQVIEKAKAIFKPYTLEFDRVEWFSVYPIGQGISEKYTLDERVFLGGDACHTHSPKAGQGMNTAFLDAANLAWKIHHVESGFASRSILSTYEPERKHVAEELLNFDAKYAKLFSTRLPSAGEVQAASKEANASTGTVENDFVKTFKASCEFTSGYGVKYMANALNWTPAHTSTHPLILHPDNNGTKLRAGYILTPATVRRVVDANVVHLEQEIPLNGSFRVYVFAGVLGKRVGALQDLARGLEAKGSVLSKYAHGTSTSTHEKHNPHSRFFTFASIFRAQRGEIEITDALPPLLARYRDHVYADDVADLRVPGVTIGAAHTKMGIGEDGAVVVVRPDGYVGCVVRLVEGNGTVEALNQYFGGFVTRKLGGEEGRL